MRPPLHLKHACPPQWTVRRGRLAASTQRLSSRLGWTMQLHCVHGGRAGSGIASPPRAASDQRVGLGMPQGGVCASRRAIALPAQALNHTRAGRRAPSVCLPLSLHSCPLETFYWRCRRVGETAGHMPRTIATSSDSSCWPRCTVKVSEQASLASPHLELLRDYRTRLQPSAFPPVTPVMGADGVHPMPAAL
jgi:hypothetical protein